mmetsp:Transcript_18066/g.17422  ORF Transcript_18066/g.17422 Transcript_18066/m.17422 type:complete len:178 (-) Transcript_18066:328-861(-)|eukprot:CAMPEP_0197831762 /NCGR_PEP_ID=MMETSP1437-20131217/12005_1 /TAXON_ID=49252 ORGANISM="Eucampia antarctica, Strain CCMP1452" /NCGR_SAMPLE_ID=MMETSP1437 /ASSEMBLY_ACC=CAM_ASM_001096 /LENGTH=177 /DNA_ID=CAMNT_0043434819 /DNA_START=111 /DNA_END=644 /DNA_ORIENTATION=+
MKLLLLATAAISATAFSPASTFGVRNSALYMAEFDLDYGSKNDYVTADGADGGQGQFGAVSPNDWRVPGTSPIGNKSWPGADDGGDEPWFAEAVSTVSLDLKKAEETLMAFTKEAADFKLATFAETSPYGFSTKEAAYEELVKKLGYSGFLESSVKQLTKAFSALHPEPPKEEKKEE